MIALALVLLGGVAGYQQMEIQNCQHAEQGIVRVQNDQSSQLSRLNAEVFPEGKGGL